MTRTLFTPPSNNPQLKSKRTDKSAFVVRVDLLDMKPPIWRRLSIASDMELPKVKDVILATMGWAGGHLHQFAMGSDGRDWRAEPFVAPWMVNEGYTGTPEGDVRLDQVLGEPGDRLYLDYDFGDGWCHRIKLEKIVPWNEGDSAAFCLAGRRACPPEDIGGPGVFEMLAEWLDGRIQPEDREYAAEVIENLPFGYDLTAFSVEDANEEIEAVLDPDFENLDFLLW